MTVSIPKVLVVDDNHHIRSMLMKALVHYGYQVTLAKDGHDGLQAINRDKFDAILLDLQLPDITGHGFLRATKNFPNRPPVIMISGEADQADVIEAFREHVADFVLKPFTILEVVAALDKVLKRGSAAAPVHTIRIADDQVKSDLSPVTFSPQQVDSRSIFDVVKEGEIALPKPGPYLDYISDMFEQTDMDAASLAKLLQMDKDCASQIIHAAQSMRSGGMHQGMVDIPSAVKLLGTKRTLQVMRVFLVKMTLQAPIEILAGTFHKIWNNAMTTASIARTLAENVAPVMPPERAYILALFHNVGELLILYLSTVRSMRNRQTMVEDDLTKDILSSHCELGHQLCKEWSMNPEICDIILKHHDENFYKDATVSTQLKQKCALVVLSYHLALEREGKYLTGHPETPSREKCLEILGVHDARLSEFISTSAQPAAAK